MIWAFLWRSVFSCGYKMLHRTDKVEALPALLSIMTGDQEAGHWAPGPEILGKYQDLSNPSFPHLQNLRCWIIWPLKFIPSQSSMFSCFLLQCWVNHACKVLFNCSQVEHLTIVKSPESHREVALLSLVIC